MCSFSFLLTCMLTGWCRCVVLFLRYAYMPVGIPDFSQVVNPRQYMYLFQ
jgi:hypothetical protein